MFIIIVYQLLPQRSARDTSKHPVRCFFFCTIHPVFYYGFFSTTRYTAPFAGKVYREDYTMMRGLVMDFAADKKVWNVGDQFMFGPIQD